MRKKGYWRLEGGTIQTEGNRAEGGRDDASRTSLPTRSSFPCLRWTTSTRIVSNASRFEIDREREGKNDGREEKKKRGEKREKKEEKRKKYPRGATCATLSVEGCAEARYHEDPLPPSDPFSALLPTSTFHPATPRCLRGDRANSTDHRAFLASLASTRCNPFSPPLLRNPVLEARSGRQPMRSRAESERSISFQIFFLYTRN